MRTNRLAIISLLALISFPSGAQNMDFLSRLFRKTVDSAVESVASAGERNVGLPQQDLSQWGIPAANYSGITPLGDGLYAVVTDKADADGFYVWRIEQDTVTGKILKVVDEGFRANSVDATSGRDCEGIVFFPSDSGSVFISGEGDQRILEYTLAGQRTGRELSVPEHFKHAASNYGFEALAYGGKGRRCRFWTTTESTLPADAALADSLCGGSGNLLRIQSFGRNLQQKREYFYRMDASGVSERGSIYAFGVPSLCVLPDRTLLVLEREANVPSVYVGANVVNKIYSVRPKRSNAGEVLEKTLVASWTTWLTVTKMDWANYEGMCLGAVLEDGRQTLLLVNDSQNGYGKGPIRLKDYIKVIVLD